ncbi:MAG TPA: hypothetical protein VGG85_06580 [Terracidiphilus sp.]|jgi:hypothetical protein
MKLRIKGNSLRFRISPSEMVRLLDTGRIEDTIYFSVEDGAKLTYALKHTSDVSAIGVRYEPQMVTVEVPTVEAQAWAAGEQVGLYGESASRAGALELAIEKDFACLDKDDEQNADTFPNPKEGAVC